MSSTTSTSMPILTGGSAVENYSNPPENRSTVCFSFDNSAQTVASQIMMSIIILVLNFIVISIIFYGPKKICRKPAFMFITGLSASDMLLAVSLLCYSAVSIGNLQLSVTSWVNLTATTSICFNASVNFLLVIALDRLLYIGYNVRYHKIMTRRNVVLLIIACWVGGLVPVLPLLVANVGSCEEFCYCYKDQELTCPNHQCSNVFKGFTKSFLFGLFFYFLAMVISITALYSTLFWKVRRHAQRLRLHSDSSARSKSSRMRREFKLARTLGVVVIAFFLCWSPLMILYVVDFASSENFMISQVVVLSLSSPAVFNSMMNPIIYAARIPFIRRFICSCFCRRNENDSRSNSSSRRVTNKGKYSRPTASGRAPEKTQRPSISWTKSKAPKDTKLHSVSSRTVSLTDHGTDEVPREKDKRNGEGFMFRFRRSFHVIAVQFQSQSGPKESNALNGDAEFSQVKGGEFRKVNQDVSITPAPRDSVLML